MKYKFSNQGIGALMFVFQNAMAEIVTGGGGDMTAVFSELEWFVNTDEELVCDNPPIVNLASLNELLENIEEEE